MSVTTANGNALATGHSWLDPLWLWLLRAYLAIFSGGSKFWQVDAVATLPLPANTYANGTLGVGATLTANANGAFPTIDGVPAAYGQTYLITNEALGSVAWARNGWYQLTTLGSSTTPWVLTRVADLDQSADFVQSVHFYIKSGTTHGGKVWQYLGPSSPTLGSTALYFGGTVKRDFFRGSIPSSRLAFSANPANTDPVAIGSTNVQFLTTLIAATTYAQVKRGANAAATLANFIAYINNDTTNTNWVEATTPPTFTLYADAVSATSLRVRLAAVRGGKPIPGVSGSLALTVTITGGASAWSNANLNAYGVADTSQQEGEAVVTITAGMITAGTLPLEFPFPVRSFTAQAFSSAGVQRSYSDVTAISGDAVVVTLGGSASPNLQANDVLTVRARA